MDLLGANGKIDGILAAQVLLDGGVFFFKPGELYFDGNHHQVKGMQANTSAMMDFPGVFDKMNALAPELVNLMVYIEKNTAFRVSKSDLGADIQEFLQNEDMTGMTFLYLFKWHLLALNRDENGITASMETRVRANIPNAEAKVRELVKMLVSYNGTDPGTVNINIIEVDKNGNEVPKEEAPAADAMAPVAAPAADAMAPIADPMAPVADPAADAMAPVAAPAADAMAPVAAPAADMLAPAAAPVADMLATPAPTPVAAASAAEETNIPASDVTQVASIVETTVSDVGAMDPVAAPTIQSAVPTPAAVSAAAAAENVLPAEVTTYMNTVKPKLQRIVAEWEKCKEEFTNELKDVRFTGFSDPKIKEYRDKIADKQEEFGGDLEEILEDLYDHIEEIESAGATEEVMKATLEIERDCYSELEGLTTDFVNLGEVDYRITRRCSRNHEKWATTYDALPSVVREIEEEKRNAARKEIEIEINEIRTNINQMVKDYNDAKAVVEYAQQQLASSQGNLEQDRKKLVVRAEAAVGAVEEKIRDNNMRIEELELENKKLDDELKDASGFAIGRKKSIRDTIEYNMEYINKYRDVGANLEKEKQAVADEWNRKLQDLVGDNDKMQTEIDENTAKMTALEQSVAAEKQNLQQKEAELARI